MMTKKLLSAAVALSTALLLNGCLSNSSGSVSDGDVNPALEEDDANFFSESGWQACGIGALAGIGTCMFMDSDKRAACLAIAVPAGCGLFMGGNYLLDELRVNYKTKEAQLDKMTEYVEKDNAKVQKMIQQANYVLQQDKQKLASMERDLTTGAVSSDQMYRQKANMQANIDFMNKNLTEAKSRLNKYETARNDIVNNTGDNAAASSALTAADRKKLKELDATIAAYKDVIEKYQQSIDLYAQELDASGAVV